MPEPDDISVTPVDDIEVMVVPGTTKGDDEEEDEEELANEDEDDEGINTADCVDTVTGA